VKGVDVLIQIGENFGFICNTYERLSSSKMLVLGSGGREIGVGIDAKYIIDDPESRRGIVLDSEWLLDNAMSCHCLVYEGVSVRVTFVHLSDDGVWNFGLCADPYEAFPNLDYFDPESLRRCSESCAVQRSRGELARRGWRATEAGYCELHKSAPVAEVAIGKKLPLRYSVEIILSKMEESAE
jgi:hypothetical protein